MTEGSDVTDHYLAAMSGSLGYVGLASRQVFVVRGGAASVATPVALSQAGIRERQDLQEWVLAHPEVLGNDVLVVTAEFDRWESGGGDVAKERLDVLGLDPSGRLVVVELKRDSDSRIHLQAITYAALVSGFTEETLATVHADFLNRRGIQTSQTEALMKLREHVEGDIDADVLAVPRIVLLAGSHSAQVLTSADWLNRQGLDIELREVKAFRLSDGIAVTFDQIYPVLDIDSLLLSPARKQANVTVQKADTHRRSANDASLIAEVGPLEDENPQVPQSTVERMSDLEYVAAEPISENPAGGCNAWLKEVVAPIGGKADGSARKPTLLQRDIPGDFPHGEVGYREHRCRCDECSAWQSSSGYPVIDPDPTRHGSTTTYRKGCRCAECKAAKNAARPKGRRSGPRPGATHGRNTTYAAGCSCELCKAAHARYKSQLRADQAERGAIAHGTTSGYAAKCRCDECRDAHASAARASRRRARAKRTANDTYVQETRNDSAIPKLAWRGSIASGS